MDVNGLTKVLPAAMLALVGISIAFPAQARIICRDGNQNVQGAWLATPYCQDALVAEVAARYGMRAPAAKIRNNPNFKRHVCRVIGQDIRIKETCEQVNPHGRGRF